MMPVAASQSMGMSRSRRRHTLVASKVESLDDVGKQFRDALQKFMRKECLDFADRRRNEIAKPDKQRRRLSHFGGSGRGGGFGNVNLARDLSSFGLDDIDGGDDQPFPCHIATSTMPRACETVDWKDMPSKTLSNFNPLDKGEFNGKTMEEIEQRDPNWYGRYVEDPFNTRFPGGECQADLMLRLEPMAICLEQQVEPVLIVSHTSVLQALVAYFRNSAAETCMDIDLPLNTVLKFTPAKGGGWQETQHCILQERVDLMRDLAISEE